MHCSRGPTELVQRSAYRGSSHRHKGAASHINRHGLAISLAYSSGEEGVFYMFKSFLFDFVRLEERGVRNPLPVVQYKHTALCC
jgi:hypothetical protein